MATPFVAANWKMHLDRAAITEFCTALRVLDESRPATRVGIFPPSVYLPLVKTDMMAPVEEYAGRRDVMTPQRAATMILDGVVDRRRRVMTPIGGFHAFSNRVMPATTSRILNLL